MNLLNRCIEDGICPFTNGILTCYGAFYRLIHKKTDIDQSISGLRMVVKLVGEVKVQFMYLINKKIYLYGG